MLNVTDPLVAEHTSDHSVQLVREKIYHVHGLAISYQNLCTLNHQEWLEDVIVDGFLLTLMAKQNRGDIDHVFVISATVTALWQHGQYEDNLFSSVKMDLFKWGFAPICFGMHHWMMLAVDMANKTVSVLDSLPNKARKATAIQYWKNFYATRSEKSIQWQEGPLRSSKQTDGCSCGPFILMMNAYGIIKSRDLTRYTTANARAFRGVVLHTLVQASTTLPGITTGCDMPDCPVRSRESMVCCVCGRWIHWKHCGGLTQRPIGAYVCIICTAQYSH